MSNIGFVFLCLCVPKYTCARYLNPFGQPAADDVKRIDTYLILL